MPTLNHYEANSEFRLVYSELKDHLEQLNAFLQHIHTFVSSAENKIYDPNLKVYSHDFFEYYYAGTYAQTFRHSFITTICSVAEAYVKYYVGTWLELQGIPPTIKPQNGIMDYLKKYDKDVLNIGIDFSKLEISEFRGLLAIRNSIVHSNGNLEFVDKYIPEIKVMTIKYPSVKLVNEDVILIEEQFCVESLTIIRRFFFYIIKLAIKKFPNYRSDKPQDELLDNF